jgi:hypothetical protein
MKRRVKFVPKLGPRQVGKGVFCVIIVYKGFVFELKTQYEK